MWPLPASAGDGQGGLGGGRPLPTQSPPRTPGSSRRCAEPATEGSASRCPQKCPPLATAQRLQSGASVGGSRKIPCPGRVLGRPGPEKPRCRVLGSAKALWPRAGRLAAWLGDWPPQLSRRPPRDAGVAAGRPPTSPGARAGPLPPPARRPGPAAAGAAALWAPRPAAVPGSISLLSSGSSEKDDARRRILPTSRFLSLLPRVSFGLSAAGVMTRALSWHLPGSQPSPPCAGLRAQRCPPVPQTRAPGSRGCRWPGAPGGHSRLRAHTCVPTCAPGRRAGPPIPGWRRRVSALERESREALGWGCCQFSTNL